MELSISDLDTQSVYKLMTGSIQPRPIAWACTQGDKGRLNLAPFSFFTLVSVNPTVVAFAPLVKADGTEKDTILNLREHPEFTLNIVSHRVADAMNQTSAALPHGESELDFAGLTPVASRSVLTPRVREALIHFECTLREIQSFGDQPMAGRLVLGDVRHVHVDDALYEDGRIRADKLDAIGRMAGNAYATTRDTFELERPG